MHEEFSNSRMDQFMAITGTEGPDAQYYLKQHHNNLQAALQDFFEDPTKAHKNSKKTTLLNQYKEFKKEENKKNCIVRNIDIRGKKLIDDVKILWKEIIPSIIRGTTPGEQFLIEIGGDIKNIHFQEGTFDESIRVAYQVERPLLLLVYTPQLKGRLNDLLSQQVKTYTTDHFIVLGLLSSNQQFAKSLKQINHSQPSLSVFRTNFINQVQLMSECDIKPQTSAAQILSFLRRSLDSIHEEQVLESDIKREVNYLQEDQYDDHQQNILMQPEQSRQAQQRDYELERQIKRIQQQQFNQMKQQHQRKKSQQLQQILQGKLNQQKLQQLQEDRKARKLSLPQQPTLGSIITFNFKLPMGGRILRSFQKSDKIDLIYNYIELQDKIQFENQLDRKFDLMIMNPLTSLSDKRNLTMQQVFGDEKQEVLLVKQF